MALTQITWKQTPHVFVGVPGSQHCVADIGTTEGTWQLLEMLTEEEENRIF